VCLLQVMSDLPDSSDNPVIRAPADSPASPAGLVPSEPRASRALPDGPDQPAAPDSPDHRANLASTGNEEIPDSLEIPVNLVRLVDQDRQESLVIRALPDHPEKPDFQDSAAGLAFPELRVLRASVEVKDSLDIPASRDTLERLVSPVTQGLKGLLEDAVQPDNPDSVVTPVLPDSLDPLEPLDQPDRSDSPDHPDCLVKFSFCFCQLYI